MFTFGNGQEGWKIPLKIKYGEVKKELKRYCTELYF